MPKSKRKIISFNSKENNLLFIMEMFSSSKNLAILKILQKKLIITKKI